MTTDQDLQADASFLEASQADAHHVALHRSQILRLETEELLNECCLDLNHISWAAEQREYLNLLSNLITKIRGCTNTINDFPFALRSDKITSIRIPEGHDLSLVPTGSYALNCLTKKTGNANVVPTLDCAIVVPNSFWSTKDYQNNRYLDVSRSIRKNENNLTFFAQPQDNLETEFNPLVYCQVSFGK